MKNQFEKDDDEESGSGSSSETSETVHEDEEGERNGNNVKATKPKKKKKSARTGDDSKNKKALSRLKGQRVIARCNLDGYYYAGHILSCSSAEKAVVDFDELDRSIVHTKHVIPISGSIARPFIKEGDAVLVLVKNAITGLHCHVPGLVVMAPRADNAQAKFYRILAYNRRYVSAMRYQLVKISAPKFRGAVDYIIERAKQLGLVAVAPPQVGNRKAATSQSVAGSEDVVLSASGNGSRKPRIRSAGGSVDGVYETPQQPQSEVSKKHHHRHHHHHHHHHNRRGSESNSSNDSQSRENDNEREGRGERSHGGVQIERGTQATQIIQFSSKHQSNSSLINNGSQDRAVSPIAFLSPKIDDHIGDLTPRGQHGTKLHSSPPPPTPDDEEEQRTRRFQSSVVTIPYSNFNNGNNINTQKSQELTPQLPPQTLDGTFKPNQNVLARFPDDGWYYLCKIEQDLGDGSYVVRDRTDDTELVWKEDIIDASDERSLPFRVGELVIAEHPEFPRSFCPAVVVADEDERRMHHQGLVFVRFYDGIETRVDRRACKVIQSSKFDDDVLYIVHCERQWVGQTVVVRNQAGTYEVGLVRERVGDGRNYMIELLNKPRDGSSPFVSVSSTHIFGRYTKARQLKPGDRVLALFDPDKPEYLPGTVRSIFDPSKQRSGSGSYRNSSNSGSSPALVMSPTSRSSPEDRQPLLTVKFINGAIVNGLMLCHAFYLNNEYFIEAERAYKQAIIASGDYATYAKGALKLGEIAGEAEELSKSILQVHIKPAVVVNVANQQEEETITTITSTNTAINSSLSAGEITETTENYEEDDDDDDSDDDFDENEETEEESG